MTKTRTISLALAGTLALSTAALAQDDGDSRNLGAAGPELRTAELRLWSGYDSV